MTYEIISIDDVKAIHKGHFFSDGAKDFFKSRWSRKAYQYRNEIYFVTSEKTGALGDRFYTVRQCDAETGDIKTVGEFQGFATKRQAIAGIKRIIAEAAYFDAKEYSEMKYFQTNVWG